jgi:hypothetical protein
MEEKRIKAALVPNIAPLARNKGCNPSQRFCDGILGIGLGDEGTRILI